MAGRPPLPLGTAGTVRVYQQGPKSFQARTQVRDPDGHVRQVARTGGSKTAARHALAEALRDRRAGTTADLTADSTVATLAERWWAEWLEKAHSPNSATLYRDRLDKQVLPALGALRVRELSVGVIDRLLKEVATRNGPGTAKVARSVLSGMCGYAARHDALDRNPVRDAAPIAKPVDRKPATALTVGQAVDLRWKYWSDERAKARDLPALLDFMLATGVRLSEACAVEWESIDLDAGTVRVGVGVLVCERGRPPYIRREASSKLSQRVLELPSWAVEMLRERRETLSGPYAFPAPLGGLRDRRNTTRAIRDAFTAAGYDEAASHILRKTVATTMDTAGLSSRAAADQLGHAKPSMTQDKYYGRNGVPTGVAGALEALALPEAG